MQEFLTTLTVERAPAEKGGVLKGLASAHVGCERKKTDAVGERCEVLAEDRARLDLIEQNTSLATWPEMGPDHGNAVLRGPEVCR